MLFNSIAFAVFLPVVFLLYWLMPARSRQAQNLFLLAASYWFYGSWDWRFLSLIALISLANYLIAIGLAHTTVRGWRRSLLAAGLLSSLGLLASFKYFNFFSSSLAQILAAGGHPVDPTILDIVLPVGISFYTFQALSYTIDVYRGQQEVTRDPIAFFAFVSFFPQLVAGPIERAGCLLPQFLRPRAFSIERASDGMRQILWGLFKKVVIADGCAVFVNAVFNDYGTHNGSALAMAAVCFAFQIYGDFSGYSDIAIGTAKLFGIELMQNFAFPYFARDMGEFWRRWHISLSTWFRDYVYIPLGGSRRGPWRSIRNVLVVFLLSGFWHGANWTFVAWGLVHACYFIPCLLLGTNRSHMNMVASGRLLPKVEDVFRIGTTFTLTVLAWVFFRSPSIGDAISYLRLMISPTLFAYPTAHPTRATVVMVVLLFSIEWIQREHKHALELDETAVPAPIRWCIYYAILVALFVLGKGGQAFIYFQF